MCAYLMADSAQDDLHAYPMHERDRLLYLMCVAPAQYREWIEEYTSRTIARLCWGTSRAADGLRSTTFGLLETISPSGALPNLLNFLRHLPSWSSPWQGVETARHDAEDRLFFANMDMAVHGFLTGTARPSFMRSFFDLKLNSGSEKVRKRWSNQLQALHVVGLMAIAGALTIGSPIQGYLLAMCHYPDWQQRLQAEIDSVLAGMCPAWRHRDSLPLLRSVVKEVIRWRPPVPTGIPHAVEKGDVYNGYFIPTGATIHALEW
jgi:hypothetical protein